ncbi:MAG: hypothetical protein BroJett011_14350 [Chloroflexota bacterium]|nr:MAG: hypothetical protein BroJett011_14350 [Chloroflexota bacterium]
MTDFAAWLSEELKRRGWSQREAARRAGLSQASVAKPISGERKASAEICVKLALALGESPEKVLRLAGILPPLPGGENEQTIKEVVDILKNMPPEDRQDVLDFARYRYQKRRSDPK